jgi:signal transduction histidine kinase
MFRRLTTRLVLSHLLVIAVAMALLSFVLLSLVQGYFLQATQQSLVIQARLTARALTSSEGITLTNLMQNLLPPASNMLQQQHLRQYSARAPNIEQQFAAPGNSTLLNAGPETRIRVMDERGIVQSDSWGTDVGRDLSSDPAVAAALRGQERPQTQGDMMSVAAPLRRDNRIVGAVLLSQPLRDVSAVLSDLRFRLLISAGVSLVLSALVGLMLARAIARPVHELTRAANHLAQGDFEYPVDTKSPGELGELARAFRSMSGDMRRMLQTRIDLATNVSHELRTPLTAIKGLVETLQDGAVDDLDARDRFLASIENETDRLIRLVNDLLTLSRADAQSFHLRRERFDLTGLVRSCADSLAAQAAAQNVSLVVDGPPVHVNADADRVRQVLVNLLDNAIRFSPSGERVSVSVGHTLRDGLSQCVTVSVQDHGPGIPPAEQARVFERFYRGDKSRARKGDVGAGLGLSIAQTLVEAHDGHITLGSSPGQGTTVSFTLPVE